MKYLKSYKLFESNSSEIFLRSKKDWALVNDSTIKITINYKCNKLPLSLIIMHCSYNKLTKLPDLPKTLQFLNFNVNPIEELPEGITEELIKENFNKNKNYVKENALKWVLKKPKHYILLKDYLSDKDKEKLEKIHPELISQDQFGFFGLKN